MAEANDVGALGAPGTPARREVRPETGIGSGGNPIHGIKRVNMRAEIDTSPPFESVKEAVTCFGASGPWLPLYKLGEAFVGTPVIKEMNKEGYRNNVINNQEQVLQIPSSCCFVSSPDMILRELQQAKVNLGKTINELGVIQSSVESLNKKMKKEKVFLTRTREKLASKFAVVSSQERAQEQARLNPPASHAECTFDDPSDMRNLNCDSEQYNRIVETRRSEVSNPLPVFEEQGFCVKFAEMRWFAAKKMEEAAKAAEAIALADIKALSNAQRTYEFPPPEPEKVAFSLANRSLLNPNAQIPEEYTLKKEINSKFQIDETYVSKLTILKKLEEATKEVLHSRQILTDALSRIEIENRKQHAATEALPRLIPEDDIKEKTLYNSMNCYKFNQAGTFQGNPLQEVTRSTTAANNNPKPVLRPTLSMRDVLSRKQVPEGYATRKEMEEHSERQKVALSQMLQALREDSTLTPKAEKDRSDQKQFMVQRKKFGYIQISLPLARPSKERA